MLTFETIDGMNHICFDERLICAYSADLYEDEAGEIISSHFRLMERDELVSLANGVYESAEDEEELDEDLKMLADLALDIIDEMDGEDEDDGEGDTVDWGLN